MTIENFKWTDELVMRFDGWLFTYGMRKEDKIQEFKEMIIREINNKQKLINMKHKENSSKQVLEWYDNFVDYVMQYYSNIYNSACEYADLKEQEK
ncbi:MAG: hypothetical protein GOVbin3009_42 [Prokaryotic dsDNA virus sp.]|mgnify:CR=1 FL=1|jgi:hypothetical protein|nr:MAG: hypothetical protein GOVbin3009_42 [Prokaryotic dsDNA virus sp.]|tara:strand:+ start:2384 stop:2668 length:285 start_codon:yes stop_codon:yes gene_type:complete